MIRWLRNAALAASLLPGFALAGLDFGVLEDQPPGEQYRQLSLMILIAREADPALIESLQEFGGAEPRGVIDAEEYRTPLTRIVDQQSMLAGAAHMFRFTQEHKDQVMARLNAIEAGNPVLISMVDMRLVTEDAIIIRHAIADSIEYSRLTARAGVPGHVSVYRAQTLHLRNVLEYEQFDAELDRLTEQAIASVGGKLEAYQRMFDDEVESESFDRHIEAAEFIYQRAGTFDKRSAEMTEEIIKNMVLLESEVDNQPRPKTTDP